MIDISLFEYGSPTYEMSIFKNIPIEKLEETKQKVSKLWPNVKFRVVYRGPRYDPNRLYTLKRDAHKFSIYTKKGQL